MKSWKLLCGTVILATTATNVMAQPLGDGAKGKYVDSYFYYDTTATNTNLDITAFKANVFFKTRPAEYRSAMELFKASFGLSNDLYPRAVSYRDSLDILSRESANLTRDQKLLILSLSGSRLSSFYSVTTQNRNTSEELFQNSQVNGKQGGICGDIHQYLAGQAKALGFTDVGIQTGLWQKSKSGEDSGGHIIYHFRDPKTGLYYIQNYSQVISTGQTTQQSMLEVSNRVLGPLVGFVSVEGAQGKYHGYVPQAALWVKQGIESVAYQGADSSVLKVRVGNYAVSYTHLTLPTKA